MSSDESSLTLDEVNQALENIENQYSPNKKRDAKNEIEEELLILSEVLFCMEMKSLFYVYTFLGTRNGWSSSIKHCKAYKFNFKRCY